MRMRKLGSELEVAEIGFGCMALSGVYGPAEDARSIALLHEAIDKGVTLLDTADAYGPFHNEELVGKALAGVRDRVVLASKFGQRKNADGTRTVCGTPAYVREACEASLVRLRVDRIDLYYQHRVDKTVPIEETVGAMADLVDAGKVRYLGLSEVSENTLRRASAVHPIAAVQSELSLWTRDDEATILPVCRELGVGYVAYSPLGRGFLAAPVGAADTLDAKDLRKTMPRFAAQNAQHNRRLAERVHSLAAANGVTPAQLALAWVLHLGDNVVPIPGTRSAQHLAENLAAARIVLTPAEIAALEEAAPVGFAQGDRYSAATMGLIDR